MRNKHQVSEQAVVIGAKIRQLRTEQKLSQLRLGKMLGISYQSVQKYEGGKVELTVERLMQIARALGVHYAVLLGDGVDAPLIPMQMAAPCAECNIHDLDAEILDDNSVIALFGCSEYGLKQRVLSPIKGWTCPARKVD